MKKITLIIFLMLFSLGNAQNAPITFETASPGATWTFTTFENGGGLGYEKVANPSATGINTSATVGKFTALQVGQPYAGCETMHGSDIGTFTLSATNSTVKIMVWKSVISDVGIKFATASGGSTGEIKVANTKINEWEELTFDFSSKIGQGVSTNIDQIVFFLDFQTRSADNICYFDNITFSPQIGAPPVATAPTTAAPTPTNVPSDVISLFSNAYTNVGITTWRTDWSGGSNLTDLQIAGNDTKKYDALSYFGVDVTGSINATDMINFNLNLWTPDVTTFKVKLVDFGADGSYGGGDDVEFEVTKTPTVSGWNTFKIPLSEFTGLSTRAHIAQLVFSGSPAGTIYIDNVYFDKTVVVVPPTAPYAPVTFETGQYGSTWTVTTFENGGGLGYEKVANPNPAGINTSATVAKFTALQTGQPYAGCETMHGTDLGTFTLNATNSTIKIMVWKPVISDVGIKFATASGGSTGEIKVANTKINEWEELTFNFASKIGEGVSTNIDQIVFFPDFQTRSSNTVCYFDNITFSAQITSPPVATAPTVAAPTPTKAAVDVISMFSNAYTNVPVDTWRTDWSGGSNLTDLQIAGNDTKKYDALSYFGVSTETTKIDASAMLNFHIDVWTPDVTTFRIKIVDFGANGVYQGGDDVEHEITRTPTLSGWNSYDIPLSQFTGLTTKAHIAQLVISGSPAGTIYIDNVYFDKTAVVVPPTIPTVAAPTPTTASTDVISMFSNAYTNVPVDTWRTDWSGGSNLTDLQIAGNDAKKYDALSYFGVSTETTKIDASQMLYFHVDVWTPDVTTFRIKIVDFGANGVYQGGDDVEFEITKTPTLSGWNSYDIPLSQFTGLTTKAHIAQLIFSGSPAGTVYIDNVYYSKVASLGVNKFEASSVKLYPNPVTNDLTIEANDTIQRVSIYTILGQEVLGKTPESNATTIQTSGLQKGVYIVKTTIGGKTLTSKIIKE